MCRPTAMSCSRRCADDMRTLPFAGGVGRARVGTAGGSSISGNVEEASFSVTVPSFTMTLSRVGPYPSTRATAERGRRWFQHLAAEAIDLGPAHLVGPAKLLEDPD